MVFCFGSLSWISNRRQSRARGSSNVVGTDGEDAVLLAKFGRSDRKQFSSTWLACETSLLIQVVAPSAPRQSPTRGDTVCKNLPPAAFCRTNPAGGAKQKRPQMRSFLLSKPQAWHIITAKPWISSATLGLYIITL